MGRSRVLIGTTILSMLCMWWSHGRFYTCVLRMVAVQVVPSHGDSPMREGRELSGRQSGSTTCRESRVTSQPSGVGLTYGASEVWASRKGAEHQAKRSHTRHQPPKPTLRNDCRRFRKLRENCCRMVASRASGSVCELVSEHFG